MEIITKEEAKSINQVWYFTGEVCQNNHIDKRYTNTGICYECKRQLNKNCNYRHKDTLANISKRSYINNKATKLIASKKWAKNNPEKRKVIRERNKKKHIEKYRLGARIYQKKKRENNSKRLSMNLSKAIWTCLKAKKNKQHWNDLVPYTLEQLIIHLESKFKTGMTWDNYGKYWHIDHIKPLSWFNLEEEFDDAWGLNNLQPLEAKINLSKGNKYIG